MGADLTPTGTPQRIRPDVKREIAMTIARWMIGTLTVGGNSHRQPTPGESPGRYTTAEDR